MGKAKKIWECANLLRVSRIIWSPSNSKLTMILIKNLVLAKTLKVRNCTRLEMAVLVINLKAWLSHRLWWTLAPIKTRLISLQWTTRTRLSLARSHPLMLYLMLILVKRIVARVTVTSLSILRAKFERRLRGIGRPVTISMPHTSHTPSPVAANECNKIKAYRTILASIRRLTHASKCITTDVT